MMKHMSAIALAVAMGALPLSAQAFDQDAIDYKMHFWECVGLLLSPEHEAICGGATPQPSLTSLSETSTAGVEEEEEEIEEPL